MKAIDKDIKKLKNVSTKELNQFFIELEGKYPKLLIDIILIFWNENYENTEQLEEQIKEIKRQII